MNKTRLLENQRPGWAFALTAAFPLLWGCGPAEELDVDQEEVRDVQQGELSNNELSNNSMSNNELSNNELSNNELSNNELSNNELSNNSMSGTGLGLQLLKYMIRCALPASTCMDFQATANDGEVPGECVNGSCHFCGNLNLAPNWLTGPLSLSDERWISACLLAHVNLDGVSIPISVRDAVSGRIPAALPPESNQYDASEAAFYGNIFRRGPNGQFEKYACNAGASDLPPGRLCGLDASGATQCTMTFKGSCGGYVISSGNSANALPNPACNHVDALPNGAVRQCLGAQGTRWDEVITIYDHRICGNSICSGSETVGNCPADCKIKSL